MRLSFTILSIISLIFLPWWITALVLIAGCFFVESFYECIVFGILADSLYGTEWSFHGVPYAATLYALVVFLVVSFIRKRLAW